jgi:hypothetical protein
MITRCGHRRHTVVEWDCTIARFLRVGRKLALKIRNGRNSISFACDEVASMSACGSSSTEWALPQTLAQSNKCPLFRSVYSSGRSAPGPEAAIVDRTAASPHFAPSFR